MYNCVIFECWRNPCNPYYCKYLADIQLSAIENTEGRIRLIQNWCNAEKVMLSFLLAEVVMGHLVTRSLN
jgi:hypothetical protein